MKNILSKPNYSLQNIDWTSSIFLIVTPALCLLLLPLYFYYFDLSWGIVLSAVFYLFFNNLCITAGYHRLYSHRSYQAKPWVQWVLLFFGAGAFQNSVLKWASDHRVHHQKVDSDKDPYSISKGAFYAHLGWMLLKEDQAIPRAKDLKSNPWVVFQHKHYLSIAIMSGFVVPAIWGWALGDFFGGFLFIGLARIVLGHHTTFLVNSLCHISGRQPYSLNHSAKDNFLVALLTNGEGYHNFHHSFEGDYRNGALWYQWDPTKWVINFMSWFGQTYKLKRVSHEAILRSRIQTDKIRLHEKGIDTSRLQNLQDQIELIMARVNQLKRDYEIMKDEYKKVAQDWEASSRAKIVQMKADLELAKIELDNRIDQWRRYMSLMRPVLA